jgi:hypothetical protein
VQLFGMASGRSQEPLPPGLRLLAVACVEQTIERERRIARPTVSVVPIPGPT